jgi:ribosomal protein S18 acetylase RimI-like enzyme
VEISLCTEADYAQILRDIVAFWGSERTLHLHQPIFIHEFGNSAFVIRDGQTVAAYLFGLLSQTEPAGYVHLIGVRETYRRRGLGHQLYRRFIAFAKEHGCTAVKAITTPTNHQSIAFHTRLGMQMIGTPNADGVPVVADYSGPGQARTVFRMAV